MPELPDVEAVINRIRKGTIGRSVKSVSIYDSILTTKAELKPILWQKITNIWRRGKYILFSLQNNKTLIIHLMMTGDLLLANPRDIINPHTRLIIHVNDGKDLRFFDQRRFGMLYITNDMDFRQIPGLEKMGPEPLSKDFNFKIFVEQLKKRKGRIKSLLLNQSFLAGIGNIYGDEILFQSRIKPTRKTHNLTKDQIRNLYNKIRYVLKKACELNADLSSMRTWFLYGRGEGFCIKCKGSLDRVKIQGRYSYFCPRCQR